ncbi:hypothetical protein WA538_004381 [Blastocystis sp. DL]
MENRESIQIGEGRFPVGHSLVLDGVKQPKELKTFSIPRSHLFSSLDSFLPQFKASCDSMEREIAETGVNNYCLEEEVSSSSDDSSSASSSMSEEDSSEGEQAEVTPVVEMQFAMAPLETVDVIKNMEDALPNPLEEKKPLVKEL